MKLKTLVYYLIVVTLSSFSSALYASYTINLYNDTSCVVIYTDNTFTQISKTFRGAGVAISSFYYPSPDYTKRTFFSSIEADTTGSAMIGDGGPGQKPVQPTLNLGFAPDANYQTGSLTMIGASFTQYNNYYIIKAMDNYVAPQLPSGQPNVDPFYYMPTLRLVPSDPCVPAGRIASIKS